MSNVECLLLVPFVQDAGIGVFVWSPRAGGFLTGKYTRDNPKGDGGRLTGLDFVPYDKQKGYQLVDSLRTIGEAYDTTPAQVALAWVLSKPFVRSVLLGANKIAQLEDSLGAARLKLGESWQAWTSGPHLCQRIPTS